MGGCGGGDPGPESSTPTPWRPIGRGTGHWPFPVSHALCPQPSCRCLEVTVTRSPRHRPHLPVMAALAPPPASRSHPRSRKTGTPGGRCCGPRGIMGPTEGNRSEGGRGNGRGGPSGDRVEEAEDKQLSSQHHHQDPGHPSTPEAPLAPLGWPHLAPLIVFPSAEVSGACLRTSQNVRMASSSHLRPGAL